MGSVREFVDEDDLPCDFLVEQYGFLYTLHPVVLTFKEFYNEMVNDKDEHVYKGIEDEYKYKCVEIENES
jgi:hypothetical protein